MSCSWNMHKCAFSGHVPNLFISMQRQYGAVLASLSSFLSFPPLMLSMCSNSMVKHHPKAFLIKLDRYPLMILVFTSMQERKYASVNTSCNTS